MTTTTSLDDLDSNEARQRLWLAALHQLALADGDFSPAEQQQLAETLTSRLPGSSLDELYQPGAAALVHRFGLGTPLAREFLQSAVLVALSDGHVCASELELLCQWSEVLQVGQDIIQELQSVPTTRVSGIDVRCDTDQHPDLLDGVRRWLDDINPSDPEVAHFLVRLIPAQCPFERDVTLFGWKVVHIPPMCKINPLYDQLVALRFRCLCRLEADQDDVKVPS